MLSIIGCGNTNRCDDGAGIYVVNKLREALGALPDGVQIFDAGTAGMEVMFKARGSSALLIIDASHSGSKPGAIFEVPGEDLAKQPEPSYNLHDFRWDHALFAGKKIFKEDFPEDISVFLIEAADLSFGLELTSEVKSAADRVVEIILERLTKNTDATTSSTTTRVCKLQNGKIYIDHALYNTYYAGSGSVALIARQGKLVLMPVVSQAQGGLLCKIINAKGDRMVDAVDFLRRLELDLPEPINCPVSWSTELAGLLIELPEHMKISC